MVSLIESTTLPVTAFYAGILSIIFAGLALRVGLTRASNGVMHGDGGKQDMVRKARVGYDFQRRAVEGMGKNWHRSPV